MVQWNARRSTTTIDSVSTRSVLLRLSSNTATTPNTPTALNHEGCFPSVSDAASSDKPIEQSTQIVTM